MRPVEQSSPVLDAIVPFRLRTRGGRDQGTPPSGRSLRSAYARGAGGAGGFPPSGRAPTSAVLAACGGCAPATRLALGLRLATGPEDGAGAPAHAPREGTPPSPLALEARASLRPHVLRALTTSAVGRRARSADDISPPYFCFSRGFFDSSRAWVQHRPPARGLTRSRMDVRISWAVFDAWWTWARSGARASRRERGQRGSLPRGVRRRSGPVRGAGCQPEPEGETSRPRGGSRRRREPSTDDVGARPEGGNPSGAARPRA